MAQSDLIHGDVTGQIIEAAIRVHRELGPGLLESTYEVCLYHELLGRGLNVVRQVPLPVVYRQVTLECGYRIDLLVNDVVIVEIKSIKPFDRIHDAQLLSYLKLSGKRVGLLINFNVEVLKEGIRRRVL